MALGLASWGEVLARWRLDVAEEQHGDEGEAADGRSTTSRSRKRGEQAPAGLPSMASTSTYGLLGRSRWSMIGQAQERWQRPCR